MIKVTIIDDGQRDDYYYLLTSDAYRAARMWRRMGAVVLIDGEPFDI